MAGQGPWREGEPPHAIKFNKHFTNILNSRFQECTFLKLYAVLHCIEYELFV
jgi:hypothetical protein